MLQLSNEYRKVVVDLGWYPSHDPQGSFGLIAARMYGEGEEPEIDPWLNPLRQFDTRSKSEVVAKIEEWLEEFSKRGIG